jgi:hypothetical protein
MSILLWFLSQSSTSAEQFRAELGLIHHRIIVGMPAKYCVSYLMCNVICVLVLIIVSCIS